MVKIDADLATLMGNPDISITTSPFAPGKVIIKRASFRKGEIPNHLRPFLIAPGTGRGMIGTSVYRGKRIPNTAINVARRGGRRGNNNGAVA